jgi:hypothetical protein
MLCALKYGYCPELWNIMNEGRSVNRSQMDIKCKTCDIFTRKYIYVSTYTSPTLIHFPIALPVRRNL